MRTALAVAGVALLVLCDVGTAAGAAPLVIRTSTPSDAQFGDRVVLHVAVLMDPDEVEPGRLRVTSPIAPLTQLAPTHTARFSRGGLEVATFDLTAACLDQRCVSPKGERSLRLPAVTAVAPSRGGATVTAKSPWPQLTVHGRTRREDVTRSPLPFRSDVDPPRVSYRVEPTVLVASLAVCALLLAVAAAALATRHAIRNARPRRLAARTELERALALARSSETRSPDDRRRALGLLARLLRSRDERLAPATSSLAWSAPEPTPDSIASIVDRVGREVAQ